MTQEKWDSYIEEVKRFVGYYPSKNPCHGCQTPDDRLPKDVGVHNFLRGCSARRCAIQNNLENCAYCSRYPCDQLVALDQEYTRETVSKRLGEPVPEDMYEKHVRIFEGLKQLDVIHAGVSDDQVVPVQTIEQKTARLTELPPSLKESKKHSGLRKLHESLGSLAHSSFGLKDADTLATQEMVKTRRAVIFRLLWILAAHGELDDKGIMMLDSLSISKHKKGTSGFPNTEGAWLRLLAIMKDEGVQAEIVGKTDDLITGLGWLRDRIPKTEDPAWFLKVDFDEEIGGPEALRWLQEFGRKLEEEHGKRAFGRFKKVDMRVLEV
jgi:hypothetical protein